MNKSRISLGKWKFDVRTFTLERVKDYFLDFYTKVRTFFELLPGALLIFKFMRDILRKGAYEIITPFHYNYRDKVIFDTEFRTLIQLDGDCLNLLPPLRPDEHKVINKKVHWIEAYQEAFIIHQQNIHDRLTKIALSWDFWMMVAYAPAFIAANYNLGAQLYEHGLDIYQDLINKSFEWEYLVPYIETTISIASVYFRRRVMGWIMRNILTIIKVGTRFINWCKRTTRWMTGRSKPVKSVISQ